MIIILCNIPVNTRYSEIIELFEPVVKGGIFSAKGETKDANLLAMKDKRNNSIEYHAFVSIEPNTVALRAIKRLNGQQLKGMPLTVRQYHERNWQNDKRSTSPAQISFVGNRKTRTRRRNMEIIGTPLFFHSPL